jgi:hypothetical protein
MLKPLRRAQNIRTESSNPLSSRSASSARCSVPGGSFGPPGPVASRYTCRYSATVSNSRSCPILPCYSVIPTLRVRGGGDKPHTEHQHTERRTPRSNASPIHTPEGSGATSGQVAGGDHRPYCRPSLQRRHHRPLRHRREPLGPGHTRQRGALGASVVGQKQRIAYPHARRNQP